MLTFRYGFETGGFIFGWYKKELWRMPSEKNNRCYGVKKLSLIPIGKQKGYRVVKMKKTLLQLEMMTRLFATPLIINNQKHEDLPF